MAGATSNLPQIEALLSRLVEGFNFSSPGLERQLGREMADVVVDGIADRSIQEQSDPGGNPWAALNPKYRARKIAKGYPDIIGVRSGNMLSRVELAGRVDVQPGAVTITYGDTQHARDKAGWFSRGRPNQPPRPFWGIDARIVQDLNEHARGALKVWIARVKETVA
jgi:hypothetical protein